MLAQTCAKMLRITFLFILACTGYALCLSAGTPFQPVVINPLTQSWRWKQFPELEGKGIRRIVEGEKGKTWIACNEGIYEYNGYEWKIHNQENGLDSLPVEQLLLSRNGSVYAASSRGIYVLEGSQWIKKFHVPEQSDFVFNNLTELADGIIMAPSNQGLVVLDEQVKIYTSEARIQTMAADFQDVNWMALPSELIPAEDFIEVSDAILDQDNQIWLALTMLNEKGRLLSFKAAEIHQNSLSNYTVYTSNDEIQLGETQKLLNAQDGSIWVVNSTYKTGISRFKDGVWSYIKLSDHLSGDEFMTNIVQSDDGTIWIGSLGSLYTYKNGQWAIYSAPDFPIPANRILIQKSNKNYIWIAGYKSKVFYLDFSFDTWISYANLNFQFEHNTDEKWFLHVNNKVVCQKGNKWMAFGIADGLMDAPIRIIKTRKGQIWAAGSHQGIACTALLKGDKWERYLHPALSWGIDYRAVFEDQMGAIWFGAAVDVEVDKGQLGGVLQLPNPAGVKKEWIHHVPLQNGLSQSNAYGVGQSADGRIWIGGNNLYRYDGQTWERHTDSKLQQFVNMVSSKDGLLLVGSRYYGVFLFDGTQWQNYDKSNGLSGNTVISVDALGPNHIYVATENDICRFDGTEWIKNVFPPSLNMNFEGGMLFHDSEGSIWINKSSRAWKRRAFSHSKAEKSAAYAFVTHQYKPDRVPPETAITVFTPEVSPAGNLLVTWSGTDYFGQTVPESLVYSYKLGDQPWSSYTEEDHFTFIGLAHGEYTLQVRAKDLDQNIDPTPALVQFEVLPPIWMQMWFILLLLAFLTVLGIFEYRIISKKNKLEVLNQSLHEANAKLEEKSREVLKQQEKIITQSNILALTNKDLEARNIEVNKQKNKLEEMVVEVEKLSKARLDFFTNISHELRTPLTLISSPVSQLLRNGELMSESSRANLYQIVDRNARRLRKLINQLLEMRRIENKNLDVQLMMVSIPDFLVELVSMFENLAIEKDISLELIHHDQYQQFMTDPDKLEKIVVNLLSNAFKYTPSGGSIRVKLGHCFAKDEDLSLRYEECMELTVEDTGCGIAKEDLEHIHEPFYVSNQGIDISSSSGIGLSYTKELIDLLEGESSVQSTCGVGTIFKVYLPCLHVQNTDTDASSVPPLSMAKEKAQSLLEDLNANYEHRGNNGKNAVRRKKILVVEDNRDMQVFLASLLAEEYEVQIANNGEEGWHKVHNESIDLIVSDVMMPKKGGLSFCSEIKSNLVSSHIPVILLTARVQDWNKIEGFEHGADAYVTKPFNPALLLVRVSTLLQQREQLKVAFNRDFILTPQKLKLPSHDEELLRRIVEIMEAHFEDHEFNINQMCKMVHLSHMHFIRKIKQLTGKKPVDLLKSFRLKKATDLLVQNRLTVSEVAYKVGYDLPKSFSRAFKKEFGLNPTEFIAREVEEIKY